MNNVKFRGRKKNSQEYVIGFLDKEKRFETKCLSCGSLDTESHNENYSEECRCHNCGKNLWFHDDNWEHGYIGEERTLIRVNGEYYEIEEDSISFHLENMIDSSKNEIFIAFNEKGIGGDILEGIGQFEKFFTSQKTQFITFYSNEKGFIFSNGDKNCNLQNWLNINNRYNNPKNNLQKIKLYGDLNVVGIKE